MEAIAFYEQSLNIARQSDNPIQEATRLRDIAYAYSQLQEIEDAFNFYNQALTILTAEKDTIEGSEQYAKASVLWHVGNLHFKQKQYEEALEIYQQSLLTYQGRPIDEATVLRAISDTYGQLGRLEEAGSAYLRALELIQSKSSSQLLSSENDAIDIETANTADLEPNGIWTIETGQTYEGDSYTGTVSITPTEQAHSVIWQTSAGNRSGIAISEDDYLFVSLGEGDLPEYGVVAYRMSEDGILIGQWANDTGLIGTEVATHKNPGQIEGEYSLTGLNYNGATYQGQLEIRRTGETYELFWDTGGIEYIGTAFQFENYLVVGWGFDGKPGIVAYKLTDDTASGKLALRGQTVLDTEILVRTQTNIAEDSSAQILALKQDARNLSSLGQFKDALENLQQALTIANRTNDPKHQVEILSLIGDLYLDYQHLNKALEIYQEVLSGTDYIKDPSLVAETLNKVGVTYHRQGNYVDALDSYQQALSIYSQEQDQSRVGLVLGNIGVVYMSQGRYSEALTTHQQALNIVQQAEDTSSEGGILNNIALVYFEQGNYTKALEQYQLALAAYQRAGQSLMKMRTLRKIGLVYAEQGNYPEALSYLEDALISRRSELVRNRFEEALVISSIGKIYSYLGEYSKALENYQYALSEYQGLGYRDREGIAFREIGSVHAVLGKYSEARGAYEEALAIHRETGNRPDEISTLNDIGLIYNRTEQYQKALGVHQQALELEEEVGSLPRKARILSHLGQVYQELERYSKAEETYEQALGIFNDIGDRSGEAKALSDLGKLYAQQDQPELATVFLKHAVNTYEGIRKENRILDQDLQSSYTDTVADTYRQLADVLLTQGRIPEAQRVLDLLKVEELREFTSQTRASWTSEGISLTLFEQDVQQTHGSLIALGQAIENCKTDTCNREQVRQLKQQRLNLLEEYQNQFQKLETAYRTQCSDDNCTSPDSLGDAAIELIAANKDSVLVYPLVVDEKLWLLWATKEDVIGSIEVKTTDAARLARTVNNFRQALDRSNPGSTASLEELHSHAQQLYDWLIRPLEAELTANQIKHLIFVHDRYTRYIPMSALHNGEQYLIEKYALSSVLSTVNTDTTTPENLAQASVLGLGLSGAAPPNFGPLPNVSEELNNIIQESANDPNGLHPGKVFLNEEFNKDLLFLDSEISQHQVLHIATHAKFEPGSPGQSFLVLGNNEQLPIPEIDRLRSELRDVHLVVLSACETAYGERGSDGREITGISSYFLKDNRADAVMASLWKVNDASTSLLMQRFYEFLATGELTKAEALKEAQLSLLYGQDVEARLEAIRATVNVEFKDGNKPPVSNTPIAHPYHWAPFIMIGNAL